MTKSLLSFLLVFCLTPLAAQVTMSNDYFPLAGDTLKYNTVDSLYLTTLVISEPGENLVWDFGIPGIDEERADPVISTVGDSTFAGADVKILTGFNTESYYAVSDTAFDLVGISTSFSFLPEFVISTPANPARPTRRAPLNFGDTFETVTVNTATIAVDSLPEEAIALFGESIVNFDSMRITTTSSRQDVVDAHGDLTIDGKTYAVLREARTEDVFIKLEVIAPFIPWTDVTATLAIVDPRLASFVGQQTITRTYLYWSPEIIEPVVEILTFLESGEIQRMDFRRRQRPVSTDGPGARQEQVKVYPNPASELATFEFTGLERGEYTLALYNVNGSMVASRNFSPLGNQTRLNVEVSALPKGMYLYNLRNALGRTITTKRLIVGAE